MNRYLTTILIVAMSAFAFACGGEVTKTDDPHAGHGSGEHASAPNAATQPYDLQFIDSMVHHHDGAVRMAEMVLRRSQNEELKTFARKIIDDQKKEIEQMRKWREAWYAGKPQAINMELPGMRESMMTPEHEKMMEAASGRDFDDHFVDMMVPHHEGAVKMSRELLQKGEHAELKTLAEQIIKAQEAEVKQMRAWRESWNK